MYQQVTKSEFFAAIGPQNVTPRPERRETFWETPARHVIGRSTPGYTECGPRAWFLRVEKPAA